MNNFSCPICKIPLSFNKYGNFFYCYSDIHSASQVFLDEKDLSLVSSIRMHYNYNSNIYLMASNINETGIYKIYNDRLVDWSYTTLIEVPRKFQIKNQSDIDSVFNRLIKLVAFS